MGDLVVRRVVFVACCPRVRFENDAHANCDDHGGWPLRLRWLFGWTRSASNGHGCRGRRDGDQVRVRNGDRDGDSDGRTRDGHGGRDGRRDLGQRYADCRALEQQLSRQPCRRRGATLP